jgi:hypothetical protein
MQVQTDKPFYLLRPTLAAAVMLLSSGALAALVAWIPVPTGASRDVPASPVERAKSRSMLDTGTSPLEGHARRKVNCRECGLIESIRKMDHGESVPHAAVRGPLAENQRPAPVRFTIHVITVRLEDGSSRVIVDANPGRWRLGERVKVIDGLAGPGALR